MSAPFPLGAAAAHSNVDPVVLDAAIAAASVLGLAALAGLAWAATVARGRSGLARPRVPPGAAWAGAVLVLGAGIGWLAVSYVR